MLDTVSASSSPGVLSLGRLQIDRNRARIVAMGLGLLLIVCANFYLRKSLEHATIPPYHVFPDDKVPLSARILLPVDMGEATEGCNANVKGTYHWFTTGLTVVVFAEQFISANRLYYLLNAALIVCSFIMTWSMFRSAVFSFTVAIGLAFGTQFQWVYACSSILAFYLFVIYLQWNLLCLLKYVTTGTRAWGAAFVGTLILLALNHEQWLDYLAFLLLGSVFLLIYARKLGRGELRPRVVFVFATACIIAATYLAVRMSYGRQQYHPGNESEMIFTYHSPVLAFEDFLSNVITYIYMAISNFFPPFMVSSNSLARLGSERIIEEQHGYHQEYQHLTTMHHVFYWYYFAGICFAAFLYFLVRNARTALREGSARHVYLTMAMLLIACGFAIHSVVKYRPYLSVPVLTYKCVTSSVGVVLLLGLLLMYVRGRLPLARLFYPALVAVVWCGIAYAGLARPAYLSQLNHQVGLDPLPDPCRNLRWGEKRGNTLQTSTSNKLEEGSAVDRDDRR